MFGSNFFAQFFFGSLLLMVISIGFFALCIFLSAKIFGEKQNKLSTALKVALVAFVIIIGARMFLLFDSWIMVILQFFISLWAVKFFYKTDYYRAFLLLIVANIIFWIIEWAFVPGLLV